MSITVVRVGGLLLAALAALPAGALAQSADPVPAGAQSGYEVLLGGAIVSAHGHSLTLTGVGYEVEGLADLRPRAGLAVRAAITERTGQGTARRTVSQADTRTVAAGRFTLQLDVPSSGLNAPHLELTIGRPGTPPRQMTFPFGAVPDVAFDLLTDRDRYQPGETVHAWVRVRGVQAPTPRADQHLSLTLRDGGGRPLATAEGRSSASGVVTADLALPDSAEVGPYVVVAEMADGSVRADKRIQVWRRTVERLMAEIELRGRDEDGVSLVTPGGPLRGRVLARTPSGTPVRGAEVQLQVREGAEPVVLRTDDDGAAAFDLRAPTFLSGEVGSETLLARVSHPAHGTITASARYLMARVRAVVSATARGGALIPEVESTVFVSVSDPRGRPLAANTEVVVRGQGVAGGEELATIDDEGFAEVTLALPRGAASRMQTGECAGQVAATLEVEVRTDPARFARVCVRVAPDAEVAPVVLGPPVSAPGQAIEVELRRRPAVASRPVLVVARFQQRAVAYAWADARARRVTLDVPSDLLGLVEIRAHAMRDEGASAPHAEPGAYALGRGGADAVLVRPADAFELTVAPAEERYLVRQRASVRLTTSPAPPRAWAALLLRDEAAHGGEGPWDLYWMRGALHEAARAPADRVNARMLRAALSGGLAVEPEPPAPAPLEAPYWHPSRHRPYHPGAQMGRGVLRDPVALREELLRRGLGPFEMQLEGIVRGLSADPRQRAPIVQARGSRVEFHPDVIAHLVANRQMSDAAARTLGGEPLTVAMIERADPGFSFDAVARRVARERLSRLLLALLHLSDPDNANAQRASASLPPERWLGTLVQLSMVQANDLVDPWGRPYVFRRVTGRPRIAVSERALDWELASPGPDGRVGTADDVADPFARAVPEGTPYAVISGEEGFVRRVSGLAPAGIVLARMTSAYVRLALAAQEEQRVGPTTASGSEVADESVALEEAEMAMDMDGGGMAGEGYGRGGGGMRSRAASPRPMQMMAQAAAPASPPPPPMEAQSRRQASGERRAEAMGAMIREDFPATLFFAGEIPLDGPETSVEVPLADALTTYRIEAIAWSASGWTTSAASRVQVDQRAVIDAPIPPFATVGDVLRIPVRVENRTDAPLAVRVQIEGEGEIGFAPPTPVAAEVPPHEAREVLAGVTLNHPGEGAIVVAVATQDGTPLDAVRRPIRVLADARTARSRAVQLVDGARSIRLVVPEEASERGPGQIQVSVGSALFGDPAEIGHPLYAAWAMTMAGDPPPDALAESALEWLSYEDDDRDSLRDPLSSALALAAMWRDARLTDPDAQRALRSVSQGLPAPEVLREMPPEALGDMPAQLLLALAPVAEHPAHRRAVREDAAETIGRLAQIVSSHAAQATDAPTIWAQAAAALALSGRARPRAIEMARRTERHLVRVGEMAWVEPEQPEGEEPRARPSALLALAQIALGRRDEALALVRSLIEMQRARSAADPLQVVRASIAGDILPPQPPFDAIARALAAAAAGRLAQPGAPETVRVRLDGRPVETSRQGAVHVAALEHLGRPGEHTVEVTLAEGDIALLHLALSYGMPWDAPPRRAAPITLRVDGELGARDTRAATRLMVQNRGARILTNPVIELELPAGAELDEPTREALAALLAGAAHQEGRTLVLPLRPLAPGGWVRLPLPARWSIGGTLRGLGAVAYDALGPDDADVLPVAVLPSRAVSIPDEGPEPEAPEAEASEPPGPIPPPIPLLERLVPEGA